MAGLLIVADSIKSITGTMDGQITIQLTNGGIGTMQNVPATTVLGGDGIKIETTVGDGTKVVIVTGASKDRKKKQKKGGIVMQTL